VQSEFALFESEVEDPRFAKRWEDLLRSPLDAKARTDVEESLKPRNVPTPGLIRLLQPLAGVLDLTPNFIFDVPPAVGTSHVWDVEIGRDGAPPDAPRVFRTLRVEQKDGDPDRCGSRSTSPAPRSAPTPGASCASRAGAAASPETESAPARFEIVDLARLQPMLDRIAELRDGRSRPLHVARLMNAATYLRFHCARLAFQELADFPPDALPENQSYRMLLEAHAQAIEIDAENGYAGGGDAVAPSQPAAADPAPAHAGDAAGHPKN
jgi:hypothetical protein